MMRPVAACLFVLVTAGACDAPPAPDEQRLLVGDVLGGGNAEGYARALEPRDFAFPRDHGAHPEYAAEWWYFTGNLDGEDGRRFGFQLTFFRTALAPPGRTERRDSAWASDQAWMAHFAVTDVSGQRFQAFDRFQRGALGLAGARSDPWRVWLDDWSVEQVAATPFPLRLRAAAGAVDGGLAAIDLTVEPRKPIVLQGDSGLSQKGPAPGNASYYYSFTRLEARGTLRVDDADHRVRGAAWLDREWSTSALEVGQVGWDWFALQLGDGSELMYYQIRNADGSPSPYSSGTLVAPDGSYERLDRVALEVSGSWVSPRDGARYPAGWRIDVPERGIDLRITPLLADQELDLAFRYWEGAVEVSGRGIDGAPVDGRGYVELTGYAGGGPPP